MALAIALGISTVAGVTTNSYGAIAGADGSAEASMPIAAAPADAQDDYVANDAALSQVFDGLAASLGKPIVVSPPVRRKRVTGRFDFAHPRRVLDRVCADLGLVSYFDGNVIYVYDMSELTNAVGTLKWIDVGALRRFLSDSGIASTTFPIRGTATSQTFYVAGPPVYVDAVLAAARYLDHAKLDTGLEAQGVKVISLKHTFVRDRVFKLRDQTVKIPGIATVLADMLDETANAGRGAELALAQATGGDIDPGGNADVVKRIANGTGASTNSTGFTERGYPISSGEQTGRSPAPLPFSLPGFDPVAGGRLRAGSRAIRISQRPVVLAYPDTNSLLVQGSPEEVTYLSQLVEQLDIEKTQIELSLWIIDINQTTLEQLGVSWQGGFNSGLVGMTFNGSAAVPAGGLSTLDGARFLAAVSALNQKGEAQIVSRPLILTQENVPAVFDNNTTFYFEMIGERVANLAETTYGTMVSVIPRLAVDHSDIEMILDIEDGNGNPSNGGTTDSSGDASKTTTLPVVSRTHINTVARVPREMSLLIGGYTRHEVSQGDAGIPVLSSIPLLGNLFRSRNTKASDQVRVFLIQPRVLASREIWRGGLQGTHAEIAPGVSALDAAEQLRADVAASAGKDPYRMRAVPGAAASDPVSVDGHDSPAGAPR
ncbi:SPI-1 type 3 secretion system secretin [Pararobbsia alpina]